jgi:hypothetical protein
MIIGLVSEVPWTRPALNSPLLLFKEITMQLPLPVVPVQMQSTPEGLLTQLKVAQPTMLVAEDLPGTLAALVPA